MAIEVVDSVTKLWKPNPGKQSLFLSLPGSIFEGFYGGSAGGGKSEALLAYPIVKRYHEHPGFKGIIFRNTFPQLEQSLIPRAKELYTLLGAGYNDTKHVFTFPSGAKIWLSYLEKNDDAIKHDTAEYQYEGFDELTAFTEFVYKYLTSRCRSVYPDLPPIVRSASNPGGIGHLWVRERFVEPAREGGAILVDSFTHTKRIFIKARLEDNPVLVREDPDYINRLNILPEAERRAKKDGDWWIFSGQVFSEFREAHILGEPERAVHVIDSFDIPDWWPKVLSLDWGYTHMTYALFTAISPDERVFAFMEYWAKKTSIEIWASEIGLIASRIPNLMTVELDPSSKQNRGTPETIKEQFARASGLMPSDADNDRLGGKMLVHDYLRWKDRPPRYVPQEGYREDVELRIFRMHGVEARDEYLDLFRPQPPETNIPRLQIFRSCPELIKCIPLLVYDEKHVEDVKKIEGDDPYDTLRYNLKAVHRYCSLSKRKFTELRQRQDIIDTSTDLNDLIHRMRVLEAKTKESGLSVPRHKNRGFYGGRSLSGSVNKRLSSSRGFN